MASVFFYHLTRSTGDATLPPLIRRAVAAGWRVELRGGDSAALTRLDDLLWTREDGDFLAHGRAGGPHDADQPVLLTDAPGAAANGAQCLMLIDRAPVDLAECAARARVCVLFDAGDAVALDAAREAWRAVTAAGIPAQYWSEESGRWEKKAEKG